MNSQSITYQTIKIYLDVVQHALTTESSIALRMLEAVAEMLKDNHYNADAEQMIRCAEYFVLLKEYDRGEEILNQITSPRKRITIGDWLIARAYDGLAEIFLAQSKFSKAKRKCEQTVKQLARIETVDKTLVASRIRRLAFVHYKLGENDKASLLMGQANGELCAR